MYLVWYDRDVTSPSPMVQLGSFLSQTLTQIIVNSWTELLQKMCLWSGVFHFGTEEVRQQVKKIFLFFKHWDLDIYSFSFSFLLLFDFSLKRCLAEIWSSVEICQKFWKVKQRKSWIQLCAPKSHPLLTWTLDKQIKNKTNKQRKSWIGLPPSAASDKWTNKLKRKKRRKNKKR